MAADKSYGGLRDADDQEFGDLLRQFRRVAGLSQEELANRAGLSVDAVAALERGRRRTPRPLTVRMLADALGLDDHDRTIFVSVATQPVGSRIASTVTVPIPTDELVGRTSELAQTVLQVTDVHTRLLTLTGPVGVGKTRLALEIVGACAERLDALQCWVRLEPAANGPAVARAVATSLGLRLVADHDLLDLVATHIGRRRLLLGLDNCEHVVEACAELCESLLSRCPELVIVATSRELLRVPGETVHIVPPLPLPPDDCPPEWLPGSPAVRLFLARAASRGIESIDQSLPEVARIVRRLDGMPLAIELAAARLNVLTVNQIDSELEKSFGTLHGGPRTWPPRHHTMRRAVAWSYDLLDEKDQRGLAALSVFVGGFTVAAAQAVCAGSDVLEMIGRMVDKSLLLVERDATEARYFMLAAIRDYAQHQLIESGHSDDVTRSHATYYVSLAEHAEEQLRGAEQMTWLHQLDRELVNIRSALRWTIDQRDADLALRLAGSLWMFCYLRGHYAEGREWLDQSLAMTEATERSHRAKALLGAGMLAFLQCEYDIATRWIEGAYDLYRELADASGTALSLQRLGSIARERADYDRAAQLYRQSLDLCVTSDDRSGIAWARNYLGFVSWLRGDLDGAVGHCRPALAAFRDLKDGEGIAWSLINLGVVALHHSDLDEATTHLSESLTLSRQLGYREGIAWSLNQLGIVELRRGNTERAGDLLDESLAEHRDLGDRWRTASVIEALAAVAHKRGHAELATFLLGSASAEREAIGTPVPACEAADRDSCLAATRDALDADSFAKSWEAGSSAPWHAIAVRADLIIKTSAT